MSTAEVFASTKHDDVKVFVWRIVVQDWVRLCFAMLLFRRFRASDRRADYNLCDQKARIYIYIPERASREIQIITFMQPREPPML